MTVQEQLVGSVLIPTAATTLAYVVNFYADFHAAGDILTVSSLSIPVVVKLRKLKRASSEATATGDSSAAGVQAGGSEAGSIVVSLPAYTTSRPIVLPAPIDQLELLTLPLTAEGVCVTLSRAYEAGRLRFESDYIL